MITENQAKENARLRIISLTNILTDNKPVILKQINYNPNYRKFLIERRYSPPDNELKKGTLAELAKETLIERANQSIDENERDFAIQELKERKIPYESLQVKNPRRIPVSQQAINLMKAANQYTRLHGTNSIKTGFELRLLPGLDRYVPKEIPIN